MAKVQHTCTGCVPIDASIIEAYVALVNTNEGAKAAEAGRVLAEEAREEAEAGRVATFEQNEEERAITFANSEAARAETFSASEAERTVNESNRVAAEAARESAEAARESVAASDHATATSDHSTTVAATAAANVAAALANKKAGLVQERLDTADADHTRADADHATAAADHALAGTDHSTATADHTAATADHTQAGQDHTLAAADHVTAGEDHTQALADHQVMAGYDTRLTNAETEVSQLQQELNGNIVIEQGGISWDGTETARNDRVRTVGFITAPFAVETNTGYGLFGIYYYNKETEVFRLYESIDATSWEYNGDEKIRLAFTKTNTEESLSPSDPIIKNVKGGLSYTVEDVKTKTDYILYGGQTCVLFAKKNSGANNASEFARCKATGLPVLIKDVVDFSFETIDADGCEIVFAPGSMFKNCNIVAANGVKITADKRKIFDKVFFWKWTINGVDCENADVFTAVPKAGLDRYNSVTQSIIPANSTTAVDMLINRFCLLTRANFVAPVVVDGKYAYSSDGGSTVDFYYDQSGSNISLPIRKDYVFLSKNTSSVLQSTQDVRTKLPAVASYDPSIIIASKLVFPTLVKTAPIKDAVLPEWFGAVANDNSVNCRSALQSAMLAGGVVRLSPNSIYWTDGDIRIFGDTKIEGNNATVKLKASSTAKNLFEIETLSAMQKNIFINDLILDGNKANQSGAQNGLYADFYRGKIPFDGYSVDDTIWTNLTVQNFSGSGICVGTPGTSHVYSSKLQFNGYDGITWDYEHFTLVNVTCWGNGRHGAFASGDHWRIIGGAFAHNGAGDNINCQGAFESQIIGASCIDSGRFVAETGGGYVASSLNPYGYVWAGEGQGTHKLIGGRGVYLHTGTYNMTLIGVRINNQNADGLRVERGRGIVIADCQFNYNNETRNPAFDNVVGVVSIANTYFGDVLKDTGQVPQNFGSNGGVQDWNLLLTTLPIMGEGTVRVSDYFNAANRPASAGDWLEGTVTFKLGLSQTVYRTYIRMMDENGVQFVRYVNINKTTGEYTSDSGWKKIAITD